MRDDRDFEERLKDLQEALQKLCKTYRIEILPVIASSPQAIIAQIRFIDLNNKEMLNKYGIAELGEEAVDKLEEEVPANPLRN